MFTHMQLNTAWTLVALDEIDAPFIRLVYDHTEANLATKSHTDVHVLLMIDLYYRCHSPWDTAPPPMPPGVAAAVRTLLRQVRFTPCLHQPDMKHLESSSR